MAPWIMSFIYSGYYVESFYRVRMSNYLICILILQSNGDVIVHVGFKNRGIESGHYHLFPESGSPASGHGPGKPHYPHSGIPSGLDSLPPGIESHTPIGK